MAVYRFFTLKKTVAIIVIVVIVAAVGIYILSQDGGAPLGNPPSADFTFDVSGPTVSFTSISTDADGMIVQCSWNFGDGATSSAQNPTHQYDHAGTYTATLIVTDNDGNTDSISKTVTITTTQQPQDSDGDGYTDDVDAFPYDSSEWLDSDNDGYGDNSDAFPYDATEHLDSDGDGVGDNKDAFPYDPSETKDSDGDGIGDNADIDDDNDGYNDNEDYLPYQNAKLRISISKFQIKDEVDGWPYNSIRAQVYFEIYIDGTKIVRAPSEGKGNIWDVDVGELKTVNWDYTYDVPDGTLTHEVNIRMYDEDGGGFDDDLLDIDGHDNTKGCTIAYNIVTGEWTGDDMDGITDGSDDGTQYSDDDDAYLEYNIITV